MQIVFHPRTARGERSATGMTFSLMIFGAITDTISIAELPPNSPGHSGALPEIRDKQETFKPPSKRFSTKYSQQLASLMTLNFQQFDDVSLMAA